ncbi:EamA family transporter [Xylophilus sp. Kf1]|nr:EamA family transporter [Xylophilus sp. Kf1]
MTRTGSGWLAGSVGVLIFAGSLPATRVAVGGFDPVFLTSARAAIAGVLGLALLRVLRQRLPARADLPSLALTAAGVVIGFPLFTALALQRVTSAHSIVFLGLLPLCTAVFAVLRAGERLRQPFWWFSVAGAACVVGHAALGGPAAGRLPAAWQGDLFMLAAIGVCGMGYAEGARLARRLGAWQVICWALVLCLPATLPLALWAAPVSFAGVGAAAWAGFAYVSVFSMLIGFFFWYRGLALGGIAAVGQLQLLQPFIALALAAGLLHEPVGWDLLAVTLAAAACVAGARRFAR